MLQSRIILREDIEMYVLPVNHLIWWGKQIDTGADQDSEDLQDGNLAR